MVFLLFSQKLSDDSIQQFEVVVSFFGGDWLLSGFQEEIVIKISLSANDDTFQEHHEAIVSKKIVSPQFLAAQFKI